MSGNMQIQTDVLGGLLFINEKDVYKRLGAFLSEERAGDNKNYSELMKPADMKPYTAVSFREQDGEKLPNVLTPAFEARELVLQFAITAPDRDAFMDRYNRFLTLLKTGESGWLRITVPELRRTYRVYYMGCTGWKQLTDFGGEVVARFSVKFREPKPHQSLFIAAIDNDIEIVP